jgi:mercuric ion binding protein
MQRLILAGLATLFLSTVPVLAGERTVTLSVENMTCESCPYIVRTVLESVPGVIQADVQFPEGTAVVTYDDEETDPAQMTAATAGLGYPSRMIETTGGSPSVAYGLLKSRLAGSQTAAGTISTR